MDRSIVKAVENRGFGISRQVLLPEVNSFDELFEDFLPYELGSLSFSICPRFSVGIGRIGPFCSFKTVNNERKFFEVRASDLIMDVLNQYSVHTDTLNSSISFSIIEWNDPKIALVVAQRMDMLSDYWLACINPSTIPQFQAPFKRTK